MREDGALPFPFILRFSVRIRPLAALSAVALSAVLLAGCASSAAGARGEPDAARRSPTCASAAAPSGAASDSVTVDGDVGEESDRDVRPRRSRSPSCRRTVIDEGTGDPVESGELVSYALTAFDADTGEKLGSVGYGEDPCCPRQISPDNPVGQILGCATPGSRIVVAFPPADPNAGAGLRHRRPRRRPDRGVGRAAGAGRRACRPSTLADDGAPTIELPGRRCADRRSSSRCSRRATARPSRPATPSSSSTPASSGRTARSSTRAGRAARPRRSRRPAWSTASARRSRVRPSARRSLVVIPPAFGYGEAGSTEHELAGETLVFVVDILGVQHAAPAQ